MIYRITDITPQQKGGLFNIYVNGAFGFSADAGFIADTGITVGNEYSETVYSALLISAETRRAVRHSLYLLERRDFSSKELAKRLTEKGYSAECAEAAADKVKALGYIDDMRYAERLIERGRNRSGAKHLLYELSKAGIPRDTAEELLSEKYDESEDGVNAVYTEMKRRLRGAAVTDRKELQKLFGHFRTKGFGFDTIKAAYEKYCENGDE